MPEMIVNPLIYTSNADIMNAIRSDASSDYQKRIPEATKAGVTDVITNLTKFRPQMNEFMDSLVNRIGIVIARNTSWTNPLSQFKRGMLTYGDTIEEIQMGLLKAHTYDPSREYLEKDIFGTEKVYSESNFHKVNRADFYKVTVNEPMLQRAFLEPNGLSQLVSQIMSAPTTSDQWDEFLLTVQLFSEYENAGGYYHVHIDDVQSMNSTTDQVKDALRKLRAMADTLPFISTKYNAAKLPTFANRDELILFATPEFQAAIDVEALAAAFHIDKMNVFTRIHTIPKDAFNITGCQAILTTRDFFVIGDTRFENTGQFNPVSLANNYFMHHWQIISASRFVPAVMFWTGADDASSITVTPVVSVAIPTIQAKGGVAVTSVAPGETIALISSGVTNPANGDNDAVVWSITGANSSRTSISQTGTLRVAPDETSTSITVAATSTWINPDNPEVPSLSASLAVTVSGTVIPAWPDIATIALRVNSTAYALGARVKLSSGAVLEATVAGTSAASVPTAPATIGGTVVDGGVTWKRLA